MWKLNSSPVPQHVLQFIPIDKRGRILTLQRGPNVRSAANCRSFPSGMHDIGYTAQQVIENEAMEELGLSVLDCKMFGLYENIAGDKPSEQQYHWVISLWFALVDDVTECQNLEPHKHSDVNVHHVYDLGDLSWYETFHVSFMKFALKEYSNLCLEAQVFLQKVKANATLDIQ